ncbi:TonB-dependent receptor plug domain-containing protein [Qingshengfaniella alkalisoli]|uniref:TonB-dependent receptor n=1 Tax=Qingshengfaniella alkalisoli TaxID=2599296 RepID=A0A5B8I4V9_9RHOB|nr:TonB-dependent receptor [Qingshengfaniella alkalisoli]QDY68229.1 TonB-dependent receptor [Qingshengfaniella alkalisoli]
MPHFTRSCSSLLATISLVAVALGAPSFAQEVLSLDPIVVRQQDEFGSAADRDSSVYVADAELDRARQGDLKDVFNGIASVSVGGGIPVAQKMYVNGIDMLNLSVTVDGITQNNRAFHHVAANPIDPGLLKAVRVDEGVAAADAGPNALAGAVVFETVDAADILLDGQNFGGNVRVSYFSNGETAQGSTTLAGREGVLDGVFYAKRAVGDDYETGGGDTIKGTGADLNSYLLKAAAQTPTGHRFEFMAMQMVDDAMRPYRANFGGLIGGRPSPDTRRYNTERTTYGLTYETADPTGLWDPEVTVGFSESQIDVHNIPWNDDFSEGTSNTWSATAKNTFQLSDVDSIVAGVDYYDKTGNYKGFDSDLTETAQNVGIFAQARLSPIDRLRLSFGMRSDWQAFEGVDGYSDTSAGLSGNASVSYDVTEEIMLHAGYSNVFGGIDIEDNYIFDGLADYEGLKPSRAHNAVAGAQWQRGGITLGGEVFQTKINDARSGTDNIDFESTGFNLNGGFNWISGSARLTYSNSEVDVDGEPSASYGALDFGAPLGQIVAFEVQQQVGLSWLLGGQIEAAADYDISDETETDEDQKIDGYTAVNVFAEYVPPQFTNLTLRAEIANLFDEEYADRATYGGDYASVIPLSEPGRSFNVTATINF